MSVLYSLAVFYVADRQNDFFRGLPSAFEE